MNRHELHEAVRDVLGEGRTVSSIQNTIDANLHMFKSDLERARESRFLPDEIDALETLIGNMEGALKELTKAFKQDSAMAARRQGDKKRSRPRLSSLFKKMRREPSMA